MERSITTDMIFQALQNLHSDAQKVIRINIFITALVVTAAFVVLAFILMRANKDMTFGLLILLPIVFFLSLFFIYPAKVYRYTHYGLVDEVFYLQKGWFFKKRTAVAQNRIQHTDVEQGPILRHYGLAQLILHTAGVKEADISVTGIDYALAIKIRDHLLEANKRSNNKAKEDTDQLSSTSEQADVAMPPFYATSVLALQSDVVFSQKHEEE